MYHEVFPRNGYLYSRFSWRRIFGQWLGALSYLLFSPSVCPLWFFAFLIAMSCRLVFLAHPFQTCLSWIGGIFPPLGRPLICLAVIWVKKSRTFSSLVFRQGALDKLKHMGKKRSRPVLDFLSRSAKRMKNTPRPVPIQAGFVLRRSTREGSGACGRTACPVSCFEDEKEPNRGRLGPHMLLWMAILPLRPFWPFVEEPGHDQRPLRPLPARHPYSQPAETPVFKNLSWSLRCCKQVAQGHLPQGRLIGGSGVLCRLLRYTRKKR